MSEENSKNTGKKNKELRNYSQKKTLLQFLKEG